MNPILGPMHDYFALFGVIVAGFLALAVVGFGCLTVAVKLILHWPNFHWGAPRNPVDWLCYDRREILTTKGGARKEPTGRGDLIQEMNLRWWLGITGRSGARWFFGLQRWDNKSSGL